MIPAAIGPDFRQEYGEVDAATSSVTRDNIRSGSHHRKRPDLRQHFLKQPPGSARARIVPAEFFNKLFLTAFDTALAAFDLRLRREPFASFRRDLERKAALHSL